MNDRSEKNCSSASIVGKADNHEARYLGSFWWRCSQPKGYSNLTECSMQGWITQATHGSINVIIGLETEVGFEHHQNSDPTLRRLTMAQSRHVVHPAVS